MALSRETRLNELAEEVRHVPFLRGVDEDALLGLCRMAICHEYPKNNMLLYRRDPPGVVFLVLKGKVRLFLQNEDGREVVLSVAGPGGIVGLGAVLDGAAQPASASTAAKSRLARFRGDAFVEWMERNPLTRRALLADLARQLRQAYQRIGEHALMGAKERLWLALLEIAEREGTPDPGGASIHFTRPTHQELAERIGSSREVVTRLLNELLESEELDAEGRVIRISESALVLRDE